MLLKLMRYLNRKKTVVDFGSLTTAVPVSRVFGLDRGTPINRYYIDRFLAANAELIRGRVLEVGGCDYSRRFGGDRVERCEVLHVAADNPAATIVGDLTDPATLPAAAMDCFICTQTFDCIFDLQKAVQGAHHLLKPGGVLLATMSGIGQVSRYDMDRWGEYWRFTTASATRLFEPVFAGGVAVACHGNLPAAIAALQGVTVEEFPDPALLDECDADYPLIVTVVARKG
ncbi:MAG: class I SAM-dependent methyltransferase [Desulfuromonas sp.]|nr:class I SAM-dependent methyltransferase [Desulfuromonas sp.]